MLDSIKKFFVPEECGDYYCRLINDGQIVFNFLNLDDFHLADELYIKMNSRGRALTRFENLKSKILKLYDDASKEVPKEYNKKLSEIQSAQGNHSAFKSLRDYVSYMLDTKWTDVFWNEWLNTAEHDEIPKDIHYFVCANNKVDYRGECPGRHYVRADAIEQVVMLELHRMAKFLEADEEAFAELLAPKTDKELLREKKHDEEELQKAIVRNDTVSQLYEKLYEDNATGKVSDEWFMQLSHKYELERLELKSKIKTLRQRLSECGQCERDRETFTSAIRRFMRMNRLTAPLLRELIDHIDVFETEGTGKNRTQRIVIYYRFVGYVEIPEAPQRPRIKADTRKGVAVEYLTEPLPA